MPINRERLGASYHAPPFAVSPHAIAAYAAVIGAAPDGDVAPPVFAIVPAWPVVAAMNADDGLGAEPGKIVHGEQRMRLARPIVAGDVLTSVGTLTGIQDRGRNEVFVLTVDTTDAGGAQVASQDVVCVSRGTAGAAATPSAPRPPAAEAPPAPPAPDAVRQATLADDLTRRYAAAAGDDNLIHTDPEFAHAHGLPGIIVQGMALLAIAVEAVLGETGGEVVEVSVRFARPLEPGTLLRTSIWRSDNGARFLAAGPDGADVLRDGRLRLAS